MKNLKKQDLLDLELLQAKARLSQVEYEHASAHLRLERGRPVADDELTQEERDRLLKLKLRAEAAATSLQLMDARLRIEYEIPQWAVLTPEGNWVARDGRPVEEIIAQREILWRQNGEDEN